MRRLQYTFKTDTLFKMLFVRHQGLLRLLVAALLGIPVTSIGKFEVLNPEIPPDNLGDKFCRLDICMTVNGQLIDLEVQVENEGYYVERVLLYWARGYSAALPAGGEYSQLPRTLSLSIVSFRLFDCKEYHSFFQLREESRNTLLTDKIGLHFFELPKLPLNVQEDDMRLLWLSLFKAETEEELERIRELEVPAMNQAIDAYYSITASPEFREAERLREKARHDEAQALWNAKQKGREEGLAEGEAKGEAKGLAKGLAQGEAKGIEKGRAQGIELGIAKGKKELTFEFAHQLIKMGLPSDQIAIASKLPLSEIERLRMQTSETEEQRAAGKREPM